MLDKDKVAKEIEFMTNLVNEIEMAMSLEDERETRNKLSSALGQLKAARAWMIKLLKEMPK